MCIGRFALPVLFFCLVATGALAQDHQGGKTSVPETKADGLFSVQTVKNPDKSGDHLTLADALALVLEKNPTLAAYSTEIRARDAAALQAGLLPNPEIGVEVENFAGEDDLQGFDGAETTIALSQLVELGGKRSKRRKVAELGKGLAEWDYQSARLEVLSGAAKAFIEVLSAQQHLQQSEELVALSEKTLEAVSARVEAGQAPPVEKTRARVELAATRTRLDKARRQLQSARSRLNSFWGAKRSSYARAVGNLAALNPLPPEEQFLKRLENNPDLARWVTIGESREAELDLARARAIPDLTVTFGARNMRESDSNALVAGIEVPLPIFDRNQGGIGEARANMSKARDQRLSARIELESQISQAWQALAAAYTEALTLREEILPGAKSAFEVTKYGYREGKFDFLQMLDAQRTLFEVKEQYLQSLAAYHLARTEVERLIGAPLHNVLEDASNQNHDLR